MSAKTIPEYDSLKDLLLQMGKKRPIDELLNLTVERLSNRAHVVMSAIWLLDTSDIHPVRTQTEAHALDNTRLHLIACAPGPGLSTNAKSAFQRSMYRQILLSEDTIGRVATSAKGIGLDDLSLRPEWLSKNTWAQGTGRISLGAQPLIANHETLGVIGIFSRISIQEISEGYFWLSMVSSLAAHSIAGSRAMTQIETLKNKLEIENQCLRQQMQESQPFGKIIGNSPSLHNVLSQVKLVAPTGATVLILGESGTGKELIAREIHKLSPRAHKPLIKVNCAAIAKDLYESEFFGHVRGAFTHAVNDRMGRFEQADGGTLFLDEIGEIPIDLQSKLLRVLQEGCFERVGENTTRQVDVRIITATNRNLMKEVEHKRFREDLYYRLAVFPIELAPLRKRKPDIPDLAGYFLKTACNKMNLAQIHLTEPAKEKLLEYDWPGNVRELQNVIERAVIRSRATGILKFDLLGGMVDNDFGICSTRGADKIESGGTVLSERQMKAAFKTNLITAMKRCNWKIYGKDGAAALLGIRPTTLTSRLNSLGIKKNHQGQEGSEQVP